MARTGSLTNYGVEGRPRVRERARTTSSSAAASAPPTLTEHFPLGLTDPAVNSPCLDAAGAPVGRPGARRPSTSATALGSIANTDFVAGPGPVRPDPRRWLVHVQRQRHHQAAGRLRPGRDHGRRRRRQAGPARSTTTTGSRRRRSRSRASACPYAIPHSGTDPPRLLRPDDGDAVQREPGAHRAAPMPASRSARRGGPLPAGTRDQFDVGVQQAFGRWVVVDVGYFNKHTTNGYDFDALFDTPIFFPVSWDHSKIDGIIGADQPGRAPRLQRLHGVRPHRRDLLTARERRPADSPLPTGVFRIDHDQKFQQTTNLQYSLRQGARRVGGAHVALRLRARGRRRCPTTRRR